MQKCPSYVLVSCYFVSHQLLFSRFYQLVLGLLCYTSSNLPSTLPQIVRLSSMTRLSCFLACSELDVFLKLRYHFAIHYCSVKWGTRLNDCARACGRYPKTVTVFVEPNQKWRVSYSMLYPIIDGEKAHEQKFIEGVVIERDPTVSVESQ